MPLCRGLGFQVTPSPRSVQCTLTGGNAQWSISSRTVLNFDLFSGTLFLDLGSVRQRNFTPDFEIKVLCDIFLLLSAITWCFSSLLSTRAYAQRFAQFFKQCNSQRPIYDMQFTVVINESNRELRWQGASYSGAHPAFVAIFTIT